MKEIGEHMDVHVVRPVSTKHFKIKRVHYAANQQFRSGMYDFGQGFTLLGNQPIAYTALYTYNKDNLGIYSHKIQTSNGIPKRISGSSIPIIN